MKITFDINDIDDAEIAADQCAALADAFRLREDPDFFTKTVKPAVVEPAKVTVVDPAPTKSTVVDSPPAPKPIKRKIKEQPKESPASLDMLVAKVRERGVLWGREVLAKYSVAKLGELTEAQITQALADVA